MFHTNLALEHRFEIYFDNPRVARDLVTLWLLRKVCLLIHSELFRAVLLIRRREVAKSVPNFATLQPEVTLRLL